MITAVCLRAIFGSSWESIPNTLPASAGISSKNLLAFFIFWIVQFPVMFLHPTLLRHLFVVKAVYTTTALFGLMGWAIQMNGGAIGHFSFTTTGTALSGAALVWPMIQAINSVMGALCPILINQPDVARYATKPKQATWSQATGILVSKVIVMFVSCATTSASTGFLGKSYWNVWDLYDAVSATNMLKCHLSCLIPEGGWRIYILEHFPRRYGESQGLTCLLSPDPNSILVTCRTGWHFLRRFRNGACNHCYKCRQ